MHSDNAGNYVSAMLVAAIVILLATYGGAALAVWKAALQ
jgi:hypothetical protein